MTDLYKTLTQSPDFKKAFQNVTIYGVTGSNGSGKDTVLELLAEKGFQVFNSGDSLRQITMAVMGTTKRGGNQSPMGRIANAQRQRYAGGLVEVALIDYWARILHMPPELQPTGLAIGSIRAVGEAKRLQEFGGQLISVDADPKVRYDRLKNRGRYYEQHITFEQFVAEDEGEMGRNETDPTKFGTAQVMEMADTTLLNNGNDIETFKKEAAAKLMLASND